MKIKVYGKVNLVLKILGIENSMHLLDMVTASIDVFDVLTISKSSETSCNLTEHIDQRKNTAYIASEMFSKKYNTEKVAIHIEKGIPLMAGMGGSSADAAAVLCGMQRMFNIDDHEGIMEIAHKIGSDVPLLMRGGFNRVKGTGEIVEPIKTDVTFNLLLANNSTGVSAGEAYKVFDELNSNKKSDSCEVSKMVELLISNDIVNATTQVSNDLSESAIKINNEVGNTLSYLNKFAPNATLVCGSGSACCGLFDSFPQIKEIEKNHKTELNYLKAVQTVNKGIEIFE